jgi:hypothetical protein
MAAAVVLFVNVDAVVVEARVVRTCDVSRAKAMPTAEVVAVKVAVRMLMPRLWRW